MVAVVMIAAAMCIRSGAQSASPLSKASPTNVMSHYIEAVRNAVTSGTEATNLTDAELNSLMNESIKTNLAAQLWFRQAMVGRTSFQGEKISGELRTLEFLREGHTNEAIRELETSLDRDIIALATFLRAGDETKTFRPTPSPIQSLESAKKYRLRFPYQSGDSATDDAVAQALSYSGKK